MKTSAKPTASMLREAGIQLLEKNGMAVQRVAGSGNAQIYRTPDGHTVRIRTSNDQILIVGTDLHEPQNARLDIEGTDFLLLVVPARKRSFGRVVGYLFPVEEIAREIREHQQRWVDTNPNTGGANMTWTIQVNPHTSITSDGSDWSRYRLSGSVEI